MITLISNFYNEEYLLPHWLLHHRDLFDHAVLVNYVSNDNSIDIIKHYMPDWEIRNSYQFKDHGFVDPRITEELVSIEEEFEGWKIILNTTEFVFCANFRDFIKQLEDQNIQHICTKGAVIVDEPKIKGQLDSRPLLQQKHFGYFEEDINQQNLPSTKIPYKSRSRLLHCHKNGNYHMFGRHQNNYTKKESNNLFLSWMGYAPFSNELKKRKIQIKDNLPRHLKKYTPNKDWSFWQEVYLTNDEILEQRYQHEVNMSYNLLIDNRYKEIYNALYN